MKREVEVYKEGEKEEMSQVLDGVFDFYTEQGESMKEQFFDHIQTVIGTGRMKPKTPKSFF